MRLKDTLLREGHNIDSAFILFGVTSLDVCARDPVGSARINVDSIKIAIDDMLEAGVKPVFASSDAVFDGSRGFWVECDQTTPILTYGKQKLEVERHLKALSKGAVIARLSKLVSGYVEPRNPLNEWIDQVENGEAIRCATDLVFSPADVVDAADSLIRLAQGNSTGVFHVCGPAALTRMELFQRLASAIVTHGGRPRPTMVPCRMEDLPLVEPRPLDVSMNPSKLYKEIGRVFRTMDAVCVDLVRRRYGGRVGHSVSRSEVV